MRLVMRPMLASEARVAVHVPDVFGKDATIYWNSFTEKGPGLPQLALVEQPARGTALMSQYSASDQFHVFMDGSGELGMHEVAPVTIHYTNKCTPYGPVKAGPDGICYYIFRANFEELGIGRKLNDSAKSDFPGRFDFKPRAMLADVPLERPDQLMRCQMPTLAELFSSQVDEIDGGTLCKSIVLGPNQTCDGPPPTGSEGQLYFVLQGSIMVEGQLLTERAGVWISADEPQALELRSGLQGAQVLLMQFPRALAPDTVERYGGTLSLIQETEHPELARLIALIRSKRTGRLPNLYKTLLHSPPIAEAWVNFASAIRFATSLPEAVVELAILRVAQLCDAEYQFKGHVKFGKQRGVQDEQIARLGRWADAGCYSPAERAALAFVDHLTRDVRVPEGTIVNLRPHFSERQLLELAVVVSAAGMAARVLEGLRIPQ